MMTTVGSSSANTVPDKPTLFCPECGYESRFDGDWRRRSVGTTERYLCPDCGTEITARPRPATASPLTPAGYVQSWFQTWDASVQMWQQIWQQSLKSL